MNTTHNFKPTRRQVLAASAAGLALAGCASSPSTPSIGRVVVVGGGYGGATAARYLRLWGGNIDVTVVERNASFVSCPISNLVLGGYKQMADITRGYDGLKALGVKVVQGEVLAIDAVARKVKLAGGAELPYDRLVVSPGVDFMNEQVGGLEAALASGQVAEAVAHSIPDERLGQAIRLVVCGREDDVALRAYLKAELPSHMQPRVIAWRREIPKNANGKIDRAAIKAETTT